MRETLRGKRRRRPHCFICPSRRAAGILSDSANENLFHSRWRVSARAAERPPRKEVNFLERPDFYFISFLFTCNAPLWMLRMEARAARSPSFTFGRRFSVLLVDLD